jgi:hypothetical protein
MAYLEYRDHTIVASASKDEITQQWLPFISISWKKENGRLDVHFLTNSQALYPKFRDAEKFGLERAKNWIDRKVLGLDQLSARELNFNISHIRSTCSLA